ncbi:hypothetical protein HYH03_004657 [Edaphochlamys debaryana]|uniref:VPS37 C-terminal domain-containing protein n=1 Tax=Edaphochlamys debaryana TaxID=47281 RepID=A0A835Y760_9CHLO|nr:hypothetical protein HYH03_004657 [Edaphochlamys debaryana]|eukprot:KAG2497505.1 hypothetical protein HYH03_004657 [Edaphochlamys debaryana]
MHSGDPRRRDYADELLRAFPSGRVVNSEGSVLDLPFTLSNGRPTALRVSLPAHFPQERPVLCVLVPLQHPAVDATGRVHVQGAEAWGQRGGVGPADLVAVVREAFGVLMGTEPGVGAGTSMTRQVAGPGGAGPGPSAGPGQAQAQAADPEAFLESLPTAQLEAMLEDEEALRKAAAQWLRDTQAARALEDVRRANASAAASNLALARSIEEARGHVAIVRSGEYAAMAALFEGLYGRQQAAVARAGPEVLLQRVREEVDKLDSASDALLERFQAGSLPVEAFVESYVAAREAYHTAELKRQAAEHHQLTA